MPIPLAVKSPRGLSKELNGMMVQQEVLSRSGEDKKPLRTRELYELRIDDWTDSWRPEFTVSEWLIRWSEIDRQFMCEGERAKCCPTLRCARKRYEKRLRALKARGFVHSDLPVGFLGPESARQTAAGSLGDEDAFPSRS